ncbi:hypothetical protein NFI88_10675 [Acetobacteraceae bacterium KSS12]|uniref:Uncharacterized protein n=2 Tax=Rhizosaccharibacter radicis TaxID=2782605 RepID=A0ABT1VZJ7_9PROT|nr:hypothetical protein [Acetobacteraceae bacterium KSS12]
MRDGVAVVVPHHRMVYNFAVESAPDWASVTLTCRITVAGQAASCGTVEAEGAAWLRAVLRKMAMSLRYEPSREGGAASEDPARRVELAAVVSDGSANPADLPSAVTRQSIQLRMKFRCRAGGCQLEAPSDASPDQASAGKDIARPLIFILGMTGITPPP